MILVDTSIWIDHLHRGNARLAAFLQHEPPATHPFVIGELACGHLRNRDEIFRLLQALPQLPKASDDEVLHLIEQHALMGRGLGLIDIHLLASCRIGRGLLWTNDKRLKAAASELSCLAKES